MKLLINTIPTKLLMALTDDPATGPFTTGVPEIDDKLNNVVGIIGGIAAGGGFIWLIVSLIMLGLANGEQSSHEKKTAVNHIIGAVIVMSAGAIATFIAG
jgi:hypothetical protein